MVFPIPTSNIREHILFLAQRGMLTFCSDAVTEARQLTTRMLRAANTLTIAIFVNAIIRYHCTSYEIIIGEGDSRQNTTTTRFLCSRELKAHLARVRIHIEVNVFLCQVNDCIRRRLRGENVP